MAELVAVTVTVVVAVTLGAVNKPVDEIVPLEADQVTAVVEVLFRVAENCCVLPGARLAEVGVMANEAVVDGWTETVA